MHKKKFFRLFFQFLYLLFLLFPACTSSDRPKFAVAANLLYPMQEIQSVYQTTTGNRFDLISGSSGVLSAQIMHGAPFDLFFSANMKYPEALFQAERTQSAPIIIVKGRSVFWSKYPLKNQELASFLGSGKVERLAIANPSLAPYGAEAKNYLQDAHLWQKWEKQLILGENIGQVNQYIRTSSVDAAFTAISSKHATQLKGKGYWKLLGDSADGIPHGLVLLPNASEAATDILKFLQTPEAQKIFEKYGYVSP